MILAIAIIYFVILTAICALVSARKVKTAGDFSLGGQSMTWVMVTFAWVLIPLGAGHTMNQWEASLSPLGGNVIWWGLGAASIFSPLMMLWFGPMARRHRKATMPEITESIYGKSFGWLHSIMTIGAMTGIIAAETIATGTAIYALSGGAISLRPGCILIAFAFIVCYVFFGGILQMAFMNMVNACVLIAGSFAAVGGVAMWLTGNLSFNGLTGTAAVEAIYASEGMGYKLGQFTQMGSPMLWLEFIIPVIFLHLTLCSLGQAHNQPFLAAESDQACRKGVFICAGINALSCVGFVLIALMAAVVPMIVEAGGDNLGRLIVPLAALMMLPKPLTAILMISLLTATLSTGGSLCMGSGNLLAHEIIKKALNPNMSGKTELTVTRVCIVVVGALGLFPAMIADVLMPVFFWCFMLSVPVFFAYISAMYINKNRVCAWINLLAGYIVAFWWTFAPPPVPYPLSSVLYPMLIVGVIFGIIIPLIAGGQPSQKKLLDARDAAEAAAGKSQ